MQEILKINTDSTNLALQVALLIPILAGLLGFMNAARMMRLPDVKPSAVRRSSGARLTQLDTPFIPSAIAR